VTEAGKKLALYGGLAVGALLYGPALLRWLAGQVGDVGAAALEKINPLSQTNVFYEAATAVTSKITQDDRPLGVQIWEWLNPEEVAKEAAMTGQVIVIPTPVEIDAALFKQWSVETGGVLLPGQTQEQAIREWFAAKYAAPF